MQLKLLLFIFHSLRTYILPSCCQLLLTYALKMTRLGVKYRLVLLNVKVVIRSVEIKYVESNVGM